MSVPLDFSLERSKSRSRLSQSTAGSRACACDAAARLALDQQPVPRAMSHQYAMHMRRPWSPANYRHAVKSMHFWLCNLTHRFSPEARRRARHLQRCSCGVPDWDAEMSIFQKRANKPNQLNTIRQLVEEVDTGRVRCMHRLRPSGAYSTCLARPRFYILAIA